MKDMTRAALDGGRDQREKLLERKTMLHGAPQRLCSLPHQSAGGGTTFGRNPRYVHWTTKPIISAANGTDSKRRALQARLEYVAIGLATNQVLGSLDLPDYASKVGIPTAATILQASAPSLVPHSKPDGHKRLSALGIQPITVQAVNATLVRGVRFPPSGDLDGFRWRTLRGKRRRHAAGLVRGGVSAVLACGVTTRRKAVSGFSHC